MSNQKTFFFYDLETSGIDARKHRIMQFAGQRTDYDLNPIDEPINVLVALSDEVLPDPAAIAITGITPQKTREDGYSEAEFLRLLNDKVFMPSTIIAGFNSIRFDDEFMRYTLFRNFYDPYEWQWRDDRSRWDLLDVVRLTRALRPEGVKWPTDPEGNATNRLELLTSVNNLDHASAHDALSDVNALIAVARLIKNKQSKLFDYLLSMRSKQAVSKLVESGQPFVYASGRYSKHFLHTSAVAYLGPGGTPGSALVYDLRQDPDAWLGKSIDELKKLRFATYEERKKEGFVPLPVKELCYNKCPAIAPVGVLDDTAQDRIQLKLSTIQQNYRKLQSTDLADKFSQVFKRTEFTKSPDVDAQLYDGFFNEKDKVKMSAVRAADSKDLSDFHPDFVDERLPKLLLRYKARNYPQSLSEDEHQAWEKFRAERIKADLPSFNKQLAWLVSQKNDSQHFILQELQLWAESIMPINEQ